MADQPSTYALLIGVSKYASSGLPALDGPLGDVALMEKVLRDRFQVPLGNIQVITNPSASHYELEKQRAGAEGLDWALTRQDAAFFDVCFGDRWMGRCTAELG